MPLPTLVISNSSASSNSLIGAEVAPPSPGPLGYSWINDPVAPGQSRSVFRAPGNYSVRAFWSDHTEENPHYTDQTVVVTAAGGTVVFTG